MFCLQVLLGSADGIKEWAKACNLLGQPRLGSQSEMRRWLMTTTDLCATGISLEIQGSYGRYQRAGQQKPRLDTRQEKSGLPAPLLMVALNITTASTSPLPLSPILPNRLSPSIVFHNRQIVPSCPDSASPSAASRRLFPEAEAQAFSPP